MKIFSSLPFVEIIRIIGRNRSTIERISNIWTVVSDHRSILMRFRGIYSNGSSPIKQTEFGLVTQEIPNRKKHQQEIIRRRKEEDFIYRVPFGKNDHSKKGKKKYDNPYNKVCGIIVINSLKTSFCFLKKYFGVFKLGLFQSSYFKEIEIDQDRHDYHRKKRGLKTGREDSLHEDARTQGNQQTASTQKKEIWRVSEKSNVVVQENLRRIILFFFSISKFTY